jgi:predicted CopG family antitoxin
MGTKTVSLADDAYHLLRREKREGESFSDVVRRLLGDDEPSLTEVAGFLDPDEADAVRETIEEIRRQDVEAQRERWPLGEDG